MPQIIYKIVNGVDDLIYIGRTNNLHKRWLKHQDDARHGSNRPLYRAMRAYGIEHFHPEVLEECPNYATVKDRETYWIRILNTVCPNGYNASSPCLTNAEAAIVKYDAWGWMLYQYADYFGMRVTTLQQVRAGASHFHVTRDHLPPVFSNIPKLG